MESGINARTHHARARPLTQPIMNALSDFVGISPFARQTRWCMASAQRPSNPAAPLNPAEQNECIKDTVRIRQNWTDDPPSDDPVSTSFRIRMRIAPKPTSLFCPTPKFSTRRKEGTRPRALIPALILAGLNFRAQLIADGG